MPAPFVFVPPGALAEAGAGSTVHLADDVEHHVRTVLRSRPGDPLELCDGQGRTVAARLTQDGAEPTGTPVDHAPPATAIEVVHALPKGRKLDEVVRVLTELGVDRVVPVTSTRSVVRLEGDRRGRAAGRWRSVARAAAEQARRPFLPVVEAPTELLPALAGSVAAPAARGLVAHVGAPRGLRTVLEAGTDDRRPDRVVVAIGPEGGWTDEEVEVMQQQGLVPVHLGATVLRTEHAAAAVVAVVAYAVGRMGNGRTDQ